MGLFSIFLYTLTTNCVTTGAQKSLSCIWFAFSWPTMHNNNFFAKKCVYLLVLYSRKLFLITIPLLFNSTQHILLMHKIFSWYRVNHHKIDWFLLSMCFYFFVCHRFQLKWTRTSTHSKTHSAHGKILRVIFPLFWLTKYSCGSNTKSIKCAWQKIQLTAF